MLPSLMKLTDVYSEIMVAAAHPRITFEPDKRDGMTEEEILDEHPGLEKQDFAAVYAFAAEMTDQAYSYH